MGQKMEFPDQRDGAYLREIADLIDTGKIAAFAVIAVEKVNEDDESYFRYQWRSASTTTVLGSLERLKHLIQVHIDEKVK